ncbi:MAG: hypothetical protein ACOH5I_09655 [Oligoflexus sp.]
MIKFTFWYYFGFLLLVGGHLAGCDKTSLKANDAQTANQPSQAGEDAKPDDCVDGDQINLKFPEEIQSCMDNGRLYSFSTNVCLEVIQASFDCNFDAMAEQVVAIGVNAETISQAKQEGAFLVACGEKNKGKTIVGQWYYPPSSGDRCQDENPSSRIVTACYKLFDTLNTPPLETEEQRRQALQACLNE